jgi:MFS transporter, putative metabolite:H+ symporter
MSVATASAGRQLPHAGPAPAASARTVGDYFQDMPVTRSHWVAGLTLFVAFVIESWEMMVMVLAAPSVSTEFHLNATLTGSLIGSIFFGMIGGAVVWGALSDAIGRRKSVAYSLAIYGILSLYSSVAPSFVLLWLVRFLSGFALAGVLVVTFPYFEELLPVKARGRAAVYLAAGWPIGLLLAIGVAYAFHDQGWRLPVAISSLAGLWAVVAWRALPESPYWLAANGRTVEAVAVIRQLSRGAVNPTGIQAPKRLLDTFISARELFRGVQLRLTLVQMVINFCFSCGYWALTSWMPLLLAKKGLSAPQGYEFMAVSALEMIPGYICASWATGRWGRKPVMAVFVLASATSGFGFAWSSTLSEMYAWNFGLSFFSLGAWGIWNTWMGEIYSTRLRSIGYSWGAAAQRVANTIAPSMVGAMLMSAGVSQTITVIAGFLAATFVAVLFLPETEGRSLH